TWGRYVQNVPGPQSDINITLKDPDGDLYAAAVEYPSTATIPFSASGASKTLTIHNFDFSSLSPTTANNPNQFRVVAEDIYGLHSDPAIQTILVVPLPPSLNDGPGQQTNNSIKFDAQNIQYDLTFDDKLVDEHATLNQLTGGSLPLVGDLDNEFLAEVKVTATAPLDPNAVIQADATAHALVEVLGQSLFDH